LEGTRNLARRECLLKTLAEHFGGEKGGRKRELISGNETE